MNTYTVMIISNNPAAKILPDKILVSADDEKQLGIRMKLRGYTKWKILSVQRSHLIFQYI